MPVLKVKNNGIWENVAGASNSSMSGGDADTLDGKHAEEFASASDVEAFKTEVDDRIDSLDTVVAVDENSDGNIEIRSYLPEQDYLQLDKSLTVEGAAADAKVSGDAITQLSSEKADLTHVNKVGAPHNYLDNSDFRNPVNQRGQTSYTSGGYCIDRWCTDAWNSAYPTVTVESGGIRIAGGVSGANSCELKQMIEAKGLCGKTVTVAVKYRTFTVSNQSIRHLNVFCDTIHIAHAKVTESVNNLMLVTFTVPEETSIIKISIGTSASYGGNGTFDAVLEWAALYEGAYTAETLPEYQPKGYAHELLECQRYFIRLTKPNNPCSSFVGIGTAASETGGFFCCPVPVTMRTIPTVSISSSELLNKILGNFYSITSASVYEAYANNQVVITVTSSGLTKGDLYYLVCRRNNGYIDLSADL